MNLLIFISSPYESLTHIYPSHTRLQFFLCKAQGDALSNTEYISTHYTVPLLFIINNSNANSALAGTSRREIVSGNVNKQFPKTPRRLKPPCSFPVPLNGDTSLFLSPPCSKTKLLRLAPKQLVTELVSPSFPE